MDFTYIDDSDIDSDTDPVVDQKYLKALYKKAKYDHRELIQARLDARYGWREKLVKGLRWSLLVFLFLVTMVATWGFLDDIAHRLHIKTDLGYEVCGEDRNGMEHCTSRTAVGSLIGFLAVGLGFCAACGAEFLMSRRKREERLRRCAIAYAYYFMSGKERDVDKVIHHHYNR